MSTNPRETPILFTIEQVARRLSCSTKTVTRYMDAGILPFVKIGDNVRINKVDLLRVMQEGLKLPEDYAEKTYKKTGEQ